jgi:hypothetical protein
MPDAKALDAYYKSLTDQELLKLRADGGFAEEAARTLGKELARRNLTSDEARRYFAHEWIDKADMGTVGVLVLDSGERVTAELVGLNEEGDQLSVKVISQDTLSQSTRRNHRAIPLHRIVSFEPQPHLMERWPFSDPCRNRTSSPPGARILVAPPALRLMIRIRLHSELPFGWGQLLSRRYFGRATRKQSTWSIS